MPNTRMAVIGAVDIKQAERSISTGAATLDGQRGGQMHAAPLVISTSAPSRGGPLRSRQLRRRHPSGIDALENTVSARAADYPSPGSLRNPPLSPALDGVVGSRTLEG